MIAMGAHVRDIATGFEGVVVSRIEYITGVVEYGVRASARDGIRPDPQWIEELLLEELGENIGAKPVTHEFGFKGRGDAIPSDNSNS